MLKELSSSHMSLHIQIVRCLELVGEMKRLGKISSLDSVQPKIRWLSSLPMLMVMKDSKIQIVRADN
jgi:hypothetical protein